MAGTTQFIKDANVDHFYEMFDVSEERATLIDTALIQRAKRIALNAMTDLDSKIHNFQITQELRDATTEVKLANNAERFYACFQMGHMQRQIETFLEPADAD